MLSYINRTSSVIARHEPISQTRSNLLCHCEARSNPLNSIEPPLSLRGNEAIF
ncbi:hypothetical protein ACN4EE_05930 [Geminocystis sp. CENA526]|uniref:hypothetical protein n=1 Tax=Geminocystis sp. CENA526 TaxID=1355871 RepID=UPI003D6E7ACD